MTPSTRGQRMNTLAAICLAAAIMAVACSASDMLDCELAANNGCDSFCEDWYKCVYGECLEAGDKCQCYHCKDPQGQGIQLSRGCGSDSAITHKACKMFCRRVKRCDYGECGYSNLTTTRYCECSGCP